MELLKLSFVIACFLIVFYAGAIYGNKRIKRDDGSYLGNSGGPVASDSKSDAKGGTVDPALQEQLQKLDPCEARLVPMLNKPNQVLNQSNVASFGKLSVKISQLQPRRSMVSAAPPVQPNPDKLKAEIQVKFEKFVAQFNKSYTTSGDLTSALNSFKDNLQKVAQMAATRRSPFDASFVMTKFSDIDFGTFQKLHTGALPPLESDKPLTIDTKLLVKRNCPQLNWTSLEVIPPVRKQDQCGCCYAMSTADMVAAQYSIDTKNYTKHYLSSQWISDCMFAPDAFKCNGGRPAKVLETLAKESLWRIPTDKCYPFTDKNGTCRYSKNCTDTPQIQVKWGKMVNIAGPNEKELMAALLQHGPVVAIVGVSQAWQMYNGTGTIRPYQCTNDANHAVLITGYDYTNCVPTYTIKNSWGTDWGGRGYIKLEAGKNTCHIAESVVLTCTSSDCDTTDPVKYALSKPKHPLCKQ